MTIDGNAQFAGVQLRIFIPESLRDPPALAISSAARLSKNAVLGFSSAQLISPAHWMVTIITPLVLWELSRLDLQGCALHSGTFLNEPPWPWLS